MLNTCFLESKNHKLSKTLPAWAKPPCKNGLLLKSILAPLWKPWGTPEDELDDEDSLFAEDEAKLPFKNMLLLTSIGPLFSSSSSLNWTSCFLGHLPAKAIISDNWFTEFYNKLTSGGAFFIIIVWRFQGTVISHPPEIFWILWIKGAVDFLGIGSLRRLCLSFEDVTHIPKDCCEECYPHYD